MKRRLLILITLIIMVLAAVACGGRGAQTAEMDYAVSDGFAGGAAPEVAAVPLMAEEASMARESSESAANDADFQTGAVQERLIIRTADMSIVAADTEEALARIVTMAESSGGWVVSSSVYQSTDTAKTGYIQIRVPAEGFQSVLDAVAGLAVEVTNLSTSGQDVTEEFVDLDARLGNLEATAARLRTFLDESQTVEEALAVNMELSRVEGEIESIKGRMQYLEQSSAFSAITVNVTPDELAQPIQVGGWQPSGVAKEAVEALVAMLQVIANAVIWFIIFALPVLLVIAIPFLLIIWLIRRLRRRERSESVEPLVDTPPVPPVE